MLNNIGTILPILPQTSPTPAPAATPATQGTPAEGMTNPVGGPVNEAASAVQTTGQAVRSAASEGLKGLTDVASNVQELTQSASSMGPAGIMENVSAMASQFFQNPTDFVNNTMDPNGQSTDVVQQIGGRMKEAASAIGSSFIGQGLGALPDLAGRGVEQGLNAIGNLFNKGQSHITNGGADLSGIDTSSHNTQGFNPQNDSAGADRTESTGMVPPARQERDSLTDPISSVAEQAAGMSAQASTALQGMAQEAVGSVAEGIQQVTGMAQQAAGTVAEGVQQVTGMVQQAAGTVAEGIQQVTGMAQQAAGTVAEGVSQVAEQAAGMAAQGASTLQGIAQQAVGTVAEGIGQVQGMAQQAVGTVTEGVSQVQGMAQQAVGAVSDGVEQVTGPITDMAAQGAAALQGVTQQVQQNNPVQAVMQTFEAAKPKGL